MGVGSVFPPTTFAFTCEARNGGGEIWPGGAEHQPFFQAWEERQPQMNCFYLLLSLPGDTPSCISRSVLWSPSTICWFYLHIWKVSRSPFDPCEHRGVFQNVEGLFFFSRREECLFLRVKNGRVAPLYASLLIYLFINLLYKNMKQAKTGKIIKALTGFHMFKLYVDKIISWCCWCLGADQNLTKPYYDYYDSD